MKDDVEVLRQDARNLLIALADALAACGFTYWSGPLGKAAGALNQHRYDDAFSTLDNLPITALLDNSYDEIGRDLTMAFARGTMHALVSVTLERLRELRAAVGGPRTDDGSASTPRD